MTFRLLPDQTLIGQGNQLVILTVGAVPECLQVDTCHGEPSFAANGSTFVWVQDGQLMRRGPAGAEAIGQVLSGQTRLWVGARLGFGFYRAGELHVAFVFDPQRRGLNDNVRLPAMHGQFVDVTCQVASDRCWLVWASMEGGRLRQHAAVILAHGQVVASLSVDAGTTPWMESVRGALAVGRCLLVPTDEGIVRVEVDDARIEPTQTFPATQPYVDAASRLLAGPHGVYVVRNRTIDLLTLHQNCVRPLPGHP